MKAASATAMWPKASFAQPPAVVVGACGHGLALIRALHAHAVPVIVLEANHALPGVRTRLAQVHMVPSIHGEDLVDTLAALRQTIDCPGSPVLFLTNDSMVRTLGKHWPTLQGQYALSWAASRERLTPLLDKPTLELRCREAGVAYPATFVLRHRSEVAAAAQEIGFPMIAKPAQPLSGFKTALPGSVAELQALVDRFEGDLPFLVQQFIPGDDRSIFFSALYLDRGRELARFDGHKLRSRPMGHTSIAESFADDTVHAQTRLFFDGLDLSGPVSLEFKRDAEGRLWVIEPTVGRTDFWIGLCIENGVNLLYVEYCHQAGLALPAQTQRDEAVWFNEERDPTGRLWLTGSQPPSLGRRRATYVYLHGPDPGPARAFLATAASYYAQAAGRRLRGWFSPTLAGDHTPPRAETATAQKFSSFDALPPALAAVSGRSEGGSVFETKDWFEVLDRSCPVPDAAALLVGVQDRSATTLLPLRKYADGHIESLSNYYAALYGPLTSDPQQAPRQAEVIARQLADDGVPTLRLHPVDPETPFWRAFIDALRQHGFWVDRYFTFGNWYHPCVGQRWDDYLAQRPSRLRHTIVRTQVKLQRDPAFRLRVLGADATMAEVEHAVNAFKLVYARSWKGSEPHPTFIDNLCRMAHRNGWLRISLCELNEQPVSAQLWLVFGKVASIFKLAYDQRYAKRGVGTIASAAMWAHVLDVDKVDEVDFLAGDDTYKAEWMTSRRQREGIVAFRKASGAGVALATAHYGTRLIKQVLPADMGKSARRTPPRQSPPT